MEASGKNGQIILYESNIEISRKGMMSKLTNPFKGNKQIRLDDITSIQFKEPGRLTSGYIQIGQMGYSESEAGLFDAATDENSVMFDNSDLSDFEQLRDEINRRRDSNGSNSESIDSGMQKLREKFATGEITEEEYRDRKRILDEMWSIIKFWFTIWHPFVSMGYEKILSYLDYPPIVGRTWLKAVNLNLHGIYAQMTS